MTTRQTGFTLPELLMTIAIAGILLGVGIPSFNHLAQINRQAADGLLLTQHLRLARSEAIKRGQDVVFCPSDPIVMPGQTACTDSPWSKGYVMFVDINMSGSLDDWRDAEGNPHPEPQIQVVNTPNALSVRKGGEPATRFGYLSTSWPRRGDENTTFTITRTGYQVAKCVRPTGQLISDLCPGETP